MKKVVSLLLCFALIVGIFALTGCGSKEENSKDIVTVAIDTEPMHLALALSNDYITVWFAKNINDFLMRFTPDMKLEPAMAKTLEKVDETTYEFELNPGILFHNGREVKAQDVKFSLEFIINPESGSALASYFGCLDHIDVTGDYTGMIYLKEPYAPFLNRLTMVPIIPEECIDTMKTAPVGCGPFKFVEWNKDQNVRLEKFNDYWRDGYPKCDGIDLKIIKEYNTIHNSFAAGELDVLMWSSFVDVAAWDSMEGVHSQANNLNDAFILVYNTDHEQLGNPLVRKAIALALNKQEMIDMTSMGFGKVLDQPVYPDSYYYNHDAAYSQNIEEAKKLMTEAGYPDGFSCRLTVPTTVQEGGCGDIIKEQLKKIGIECDLEKMEVGAYIDAVWGKKNFEMTVTGDGSEGEPDTWLSRWFKTGAANNIGGYSNPELDALIAEGAAAGTDKERKVAYDKAFVLINEEQPITFLFGGYLYSGVRDDVEGLVMYTNWWADFDQIHHVK